MRWFISTRYFFAHKRQSLVCIAGVTISVTMFIAMVAMMDGFTEKFIIETVESSGHVTIHDEPREQQTQILERFHPNPDALLLIDSLTDGPLVLVGSSMGGWLALLIALARPGRVAGLVGIAAAPDFTEWGFTQADKALLATEGRLLEPTPYGDDPYVTTLGFWKSGQSLRLLEEEIAIDCPVRLLQGQADPDVPWQTALRIAERLRSSDVQMLLIKDGDHRLSRDADIALLIRTVASLLDSL